MDQESPNCHYFFEDAQAYKLRTISLRNAYLEKENRKLSAENDGLKHEIDENYKLMKTMFEAFGCLEERLKLEKQI